MKGKPWRAALGVALLAIGALLGPRGAWAQRPADSTASLALDVGSRSEDRLRWLQTLGEVPLTQWTIRAFGPAEVDALAADARPGRWIAGADHPVHDAGRLRWQVIPVAGDLWYNSAFAFGENDGAVWRGRGATVAASGGIALRYGPLSAQLEPIVFLAENRAFPLMTPRDTGASPFASPIVPLNVDRPQRFGDGHYGRLDPGQSSVRLDAFGLTASVTNANEWWGPMGEWPFLLGNNAAGFPHLALGTSRPVNIGIGTLHTRVIYGQLSQSAFTNVTGPASHQFITGIIASYRPRGIDGLEVGAARVFDISWPANGLGWHELRKPFEGLLKAHIVGDTGVVGAYDHGSADNQLASVFARWVLPASGFELYGELGRDDHSVDARDLALEPDHQMTVGFGFRKAWRRADGALDGVTGELFDMDPSTLMRGRAQEGIYTHGYGGGARQGHTNRGELLGAGVGVFSGGASRFAWTRYAPSGEQTDLSLTRLVVREQDVGTPPVDVQYVIGAERTVRRRGLGVRYGASWVYELNRYFAGDATNLQLVAGLVW